MSDRYKFTGCARFLFFMIVFVPLTYFGLQYFGKDDDRVQEIKEWVDDKVEKAKESDAVEKILKTKKESPPPPIQNDDLEQELDILKQELIRQDQLIQDLQIELEALKIDSTSG